MTIDVSGMGSSGRDAWRATSHIRYTLSLFFREKKEKKRRSKLKRPSRVKPSTIFFFLPVTGENHSPKIARDIREGHLRGNALVQHVPSLRLGGIGTDQKRTSGAARLKVCVRLPPLHAWSFFFFFSFHQSAPYSFFPHWHKVWRESPRKRLGSTAEPENASTNASSFRSGCWGGCYDL